MQQQQTTCTIALYLTCNRSVHGRIRIGVRSDQKQTDIFHSKKRPVSESTVYLTKMVGIVENVTIGQANKVGGSRLFHHILEKHWQ